MTILTIINRLNLNDLNSFIIWKLPLYRYQLHIGMGSFSLLTVALRPIQNLDVRFLSIQFLIL